MRSPSDATWQEWLNHDVVEMAGQYLDALQSLRAIQFDCGDADGLQTPNLILSAQLKKLGVAHLYEKYPGDHVNKIRERVETRLLPFFSEFLKTQL